MFPLATGHAAACSRHLGCLHRSGRKPPPGHVPMNITKLWLWGRRGERVKGRARGRGHHPLWLACFAGGEGSAGSSGFGPCPSRNPATVKTKCGHRTRFAALVDAQDECASPPSSARSPVTEPPSQTKLQHRHPDRHIPQMLPQESAARSPSQRHSVARFGNFQKDRTYTMQPPPPPHTPAWCAGVAPYLQQEPMGPDRGAASGSLTHHVVARSGRHS